MYLSYFLYFCTGNSIFELILANLMTNLRELINTKIARIMTDFLGHSNIFATLRRSPTREVTTPLFYARVARVKGSAKAECRAKLAWAMPRRSLPSPVRAIYGFFWYKPREIALFF